jgi:hypothetical protein
VFNECHLRRVLRSYLDYYHRWRVHRSLDMDAPDPRPVQPPELGSVQKLPEVSGLHHHYKRQAAWLRELEGPCCQRRPVFGTDNVVASFVGYTSLISRQYTMADLLKRLILTRARTIKVAMRYR